MKTLIMLIDGNDVKCVNGNKQEILNAILGYTFFVGKNISMGDEQFVYTGTEDFEKVECNFKLYQELEINKIIVKTKKTPKKKSGIFFDLFVKCYEENIGISFQFSKDEELLYKHNFVKVADSFFMAGFSEQHIEKYIKQHAMFGNYKGDPIYIRYLFDNNVIQNYLLYLKGLKSFSELWKFLDFNITPAERKKIKYLMNLNNWEYLTEEERNVGLKLYKIYNKVKFDELLEKYKYQNGFLIKQKVLQFIAADNETTVEEEIIKLKHNEKYLKYDYDKKQIEEVMQNKNLN